MSRPKKDVKTTALEALQDLVIEELETDAVNRFERAGKLCEQAHKIAKMYSLRVADSQKMMEPEDSGMVNIGYAVDGGNYLRAPQTQMSHQDILREAMSHLVPHFEQQAKQHAFDRWNDARKEMDTLLQMREMAEKVGLDPANLDERIRTASAEMERLHGLVRTDVLRRSQAGDAGQEKMPASSQQPDNERTASPGDLRAPSREEEMAGAPHPGSGAANLGGADREGVEGSGQAA